MMFGLMLSLTAMGENIAFNDNKVKDFCLQHWDDDHDGEISMEEAASVTSLGTVFGGSSIESFDELQYFTGLTKINSQEFYNCTSLKRITLPQQVASIGGSAFYGCTALTTIDIPASVTTIDSYAFNGCILLNSLTLHEGLTTIGNYAFSFCRSLTDLSIPASVTSISASAFRSCSSISNITVAVENAVYDSREDCNAIIQTNTNTLLIGAASTVIPSSVTAIGTNAFYGNTALTSIVIPEGVTTIGASAFSGCTILTNVETPSTLTTIGSDAFSGCTKLARVILSEGLVNIESNAFKQCKALSKIRIPSTVTTLATQAFYQSTALVKVAVDFTTPITIKNNVFSNRKNATLYVPEGCASIFAETSIWNEFKNVVEQHKKVSVSADPNVLAPGEETTITVSLDNDDFYDYGSFEMDLTFPNGFTPDINSLALASRCDGMQATLEKTGENTYHLTCSSTNATVTGTEGALFTFTVNSASTVEMGDYQAMITNITLKADDGSVVAVDDTEASWTVDGYHLGDVNHDRFINIYDVTLLIDYILAIDPVHFHITEADINEDGFINIYDVTLLIDYILNID